MGLEWKRHALRRMDASSRDRLRRLPHGENTPPKAPVAHHRRHV